MTFYLGITDGELRQVYHHLDAALQALALARHFAGNSKTLSAEIQLIIGRTYQQMISVEEANAPSATEHRRESRAEAATEAHRSAWQIAGDS